MRDTADAGQPPADADTPRLPDSHGEEFSTRTAVVPPVYDTARTPVERGVGRR
jgi:hypothetical protein